MYRYISESTSASGNDERQKVVNYRMCFLSLAFVNYFSDNNLFHVKITSGSRHDARLNICIIARLSFDNSHNTIN